MVKAANCPNSVLSYRVPIKLQLWDYFCSGLAAAAAAKFLCNLCFLIAVFMHTHPDFLFDEFCWLPTLLTFCASTPLCACRFQYSVPFASLPLLEFLCLTPALAF
jgi:hypothetical protein